MAIYRLSATVISRAKGRSSIAAAAYRSGSQLSDERTGLVHDYTRKSDIQHSEILVPAGAPAWSQDRSALWNAVEAAERRRDAQLARELQLALPRELSAERQLELVRSFVRDEFVARGMVADVALHDHAARDGGGQPHAHVMLTMRPLSEQAFGPKTREWNSTELLVHWREQWAQRTNGQLAEAGSEARIDHRTLVAQREEAVVQAAAEPHGERRNALEVRAAEMDREPSPYLRASWYMEQTAQRTAQASGLSYAPVTDRGSWLAEVRVIAAERFEAARAFAEALAQRALQTWRNWTGQEQRSQPDPATQSQAAERLRRASQVAEASQPASTATASSAAELLQRASHVAQAGQAGRAGRAEQVTQPGQGPPVDEATPATALERLQRAREISQVTSRGQAQDDQGQE